MPTSIRVAGAHVDFSANALPYEAGVNRAIVANRRFAVSVAGLGPALDRFRTSITSSLIATAAYAVGGYPRAGGGAECAVELMHHRWGLSPRGRGSHLREHLERRRRGAIPARAGEPAASSGWRPAKRGYPRAGGGATAGAGNCTIGQGLSPRGRGSPPRPPVGAATIGAIPARAGEPAERRGLVIHVGGYPRAGGGAPPDLRGSLDARGLSPRGRGSQGVVDHPLPFDGAIPARAGEPLIRTSPRISLIFGHKSLFLRTYRPLVRMQSVPM